MSLVFILNGNSFNAAGPSSLTANAAAVLRHAGNQVVELSYPHVSTSATFNALARSIARRAHGQAIGLVGFSAGGALALRLAATPGLNVRADRLRRRHGSSPPLAHAIRTSRPRAARRISWRTIRPRMSIHMPAATGSPSVPAVRRSRTASNTSGDGTTRFRIRFRMTTS